MTTITTWGKVRTEPTLSEWRVRWAQCPTAHNPTRILYVEAANALDAQRIAIDHIERKHGAQIGIYDVTEVTEKLPAGRVLEV